MTITKKLKDKSILGLDVIDFVPYSRIRDIVNPR